jgi:UDP-glucose 6-dehydrogenase
VKIGIFGYNFKHWKTQVGIQNMFLNGFKPEINFVFNPEFLTERKARLDFINTSRIVLGGNDETALEKVEDLYRLRFPYTKIIKTDFGTAQLIKYMANCFFATKASFMNEMHQVCEAIDGDWGAALEGFITDGRIGNSHIDVHGHDGDFIFEDDFKDHQQDFLMNALGSTNLYKFVKAIIDIVEEEV